MSLFGKVREHLQSVDRRIAALEKANARKKDRLRQHDDELKQHRDAVSMLLQRVELLEVGLQESASGVRAEITNLESANTRNGVAVGRVSRALEQMEGSVAPRPSSNPQTLDTSDRDAPADIPERLYLALEDQFRGDPDQILEWQRPYAARIKSLVPSTAIALDIGCGRGEFVTALAECSIDCLGIDSNSEAIDDIKARGLNGVVSDGISYLRTASADSVDVISAFHIVEHLPTPVLLDLLAEAQRVLKDGGVLVIETPNPENPTVGSNTFWVDPTHIKPVPPVLLNFLVEQSGFAVVEEFRLRPPPTRELLSPEVVEKFGPLIPIIQSLTIGQDYGLIARAVK